MDRVTLAFTELIVNSSQHGTEDEHFDSVVDYGITVNGADHGAHRSIVRLTPGASADVVFEVTLPEDYEGPMNYQAFRDAVEAYVRNCVGPEGRGIQMPWDAVLSMENLSVQMPAMATFEVDRA